MSKSSNITPPPFSAEPNVIDILTGNEHKIIHVSLYSGRAEISRLYKVKLKTGQNQAVFACLPNLLDPDSIRVEGRGAATIHDVTISHMKSPSPSRQSPNTDSSPFLKTLEQKKSRLRKSLERYKKAQNASDQYIGSLNAEHTTVNDFPKTINEYIAIGDKTEDLIEELEEKLRVVDGGIENERNRLAALRPVQVNVNTNVRKQVAVGLFSETDSEVQVLLKYSVNQASWEALYDIRVNTQSEKGPTVELVYKAALNQYTGEGWLDVPLTLETANPTYGLTSVANLNPWNISIYRPPPPEIKRMPERSRAIERKKTITKEELEECSDDDMGFGLFDDDTPIAPSMRERTTGVVSKGGVNLSATFDVPGVISIPSDSNKHNVTVTNLNLEATLNWLVVPKLDTRVHLTGKIKNNSEYTLIPGTAGIYLDGSFIAKTTIPLVSPQETFDCPLGLDPSIKITYHPQSKKISQSGFLNKSSTHIFSQNISIQNTKPAVAEKARNAPFKVNVKVTDQIPIPQDAQIVVKLITPDLPPVVAASATSGQGSSGVISNLKSDSSKALARVQSKITSITRLSGGVVAQWEGADDPNVDVNALGKDGKISWICEVPPQGNVNLSLQWEVGYPEKSTVIGI